MRSIVHGLEPSYAGRVQFISLNYSDQRMRKVVAEYGADFHPAFAFLRPGGELYSVVLGEVDEDRLVAELDRLLAQ